MKICTHNGDVTLVGRWGTQDMVLELFNDLRRSEIQSTSYLVVDNVRSTMTGGQSALAGLDSFAMLECYAPASLIIDEWGVDRNSLAPAPPLNSVSGKPLNIVGIWRSCPMWKTLIAYVRVESTKRPLHKTYSLSPRAGFDVR